jgi:hypothetical protein
MLCSSLWRNHHFPPPPRGMVGVASSTDPESHPGGSISTGRSLMPHRSKVMTQTNWPTKLEVVRGFETLHSKILNCRNASNNRGRAETSKATTQQEQRPEKIWSWWALETGGQFRWIGTNGEQRYKRPRHVMNCSAGSLVLLLLLLFHTHYAIHNNLTDSQKSTVVTDKVHLIHCSAKSFLITLIN